MFLFAESLFRALSCSGSMFFFFGHAGMLSCRPSLFIVIMISRFKSYPNYRDRSFLKVTKNLTQKAVKNCLATSKKLTDTSPKVSQYLC